MAGSPFVVAHLSDLHVGEPGSLVDEVVGPAARLTVAVERLNSLEVDAVIVTGDLVDHGTVAEYERLASILTSLRPPALLLAGNHDDPTNLTSVLGHIAPGGEGAGHRSFVFDEWPLRVVVLDTTVEGHHHGAVDDERLAWLDAALAAASAAPTLLCLHHPPIATGMWWMDYGGFAGADAVEAVVARHPQVTRVLAGHIHRATDASWGGTVLGVAPAMTYQSSPALDAAAEPFIGDDDPSIPLLRWDGVRLVTHHVPLVAGDLRVDLRTLITPWEPYERAARAGGPIPADGHGS